MSMKRSTNTHIRTTHTGSLPRPPEMLETHARHGRGSRMTRRPMKRR